MMSRFTSLAARIDEFSVRERGLILISVLVVLYLTWQSWLMTPLTQERKLADTWINDTRVEIEVLNQAARSIVQRQSTDPDEGARKVLVRLESELAGLVDELEEMTKHLIPPAEMTGVLEEVLISSRDVQFIALQGLGASALHEPATTQGTADGAEPTSQPLLGAFKHGLKLQIEGGYLETLAVLRKLESLPWVFFWESVDFKVGDYPTARTEITVFTLSWRQAWIGV